MHELSPTPPFTSELLACGPGQRIGVAVLAPRMNHFYAYIGIGAVTFVAQWLLFRRTKVDRKGLYSCWFGAFFEGNILAIILLPLTWPMSAFLALLWWGGDYMHLRAKAKLARDRAEAEKKLGKYVDMSMDELVAAQKQALSDPGLHTQHQVLK